MKIGGIKQNKQIKCIERGGEIEKERERKREGGQSMRKIVVNQMKVGGIKQNKQIK